MLLLFRAVDMETRYFTFCPPFSSWRHTSAEYMSFFPFPFPLTGLTSAFVFELALWLCCSE